MQAIENLKKRINPLKRHASPAPVSTDMACNLKSKNNGWELNGNAGSDFLRSHALSESMLSLGNEIQGQEVSTHGVSLPNDLVTVLKMTNCPMHEVQPLNSVHRPKRFTLIDMPWRPTSYT